MEAKNRATRVLVVDDEENIREVVAYVLEMKGFIADNARDGKEALEKIAREKPDIIILDVTMPRMGGFELCRRLRKSCSLRDIPIIFLSAQRRISGAAGNIPGAPIEYIEKPCDFEYLIKKINTLIAEKAP